VPGSHVPAAWHGSDAVHVTAAPLAQTPPTHVSPVVHALLSVQTVPFALAGFEHCPETGSHVPAAWHGSDAVHVTAAPLAQTPPTHVSPFVHALPSVHTVPFALAGFEHCPVPGSHVPAAWHGSDAVHVTAAPLAQTPPWHVSPVVHALPSVHTVPFGMAGPAHTPVARSHACAPRHCVAPGHVTRLLPVHAPAWQVSVCVQALLSLQAVPFVTGVCTQPVAGLQLSAVHGLLSSHGTFASEQLPIVQVPVPW
jgi:hypothetical protein